MKKLSIVAALLFAFGTVTFAQDATKTTTDKKTTTTKKATDKKTTTTKKGTKKGTGKTDKKTTTPSSTPAKN